MAVPRGMWEWPVCGDYMLNSQRVCEHCNRRKTGGRASLQYRKRLNFGYNEMNIGSTLKTGAIVFLVFELLFTLIIALCTLFTGTGFGGFLLVLIGGSLIGVLTFLVEYAFGCMVESSIVTAENSKRCVAYLDAIQDSSAAAADNSAQCAGKLLPLDRFLPWAGGDPFLLTPLREASPPE